MAFTKYANSTIPVVEPLSAIMNDSEISAHFKDVVASLREEQAKQGLKLVSAKPDEFLYAHAIMMHAAEASLIDQETGEHIKNAKGEPVKGWFEDVTDEGGNKSVKWVSPDGIKLYKNANGDIFPEEDLIKAHKLWVGKPLCKDHQSSSIDGVRGIIIDTFYDHKHKRVHALFALDKKNYPDLARKVEAGYAVNVSMGTAVGRSICTECSKVAHNDREYCHHIRSRANYGEINKDLNPIELSIVVTGADPKAKVKMVFAHLNSYLAKRSSKSVDDIKLPDSLAFELSDVGDMSIEELKEFDFETLEKLAGQMRRLNIDGHRNIVRALIHKNQEDGNTGPETVVKLMSLVDTDDSETIDMIKSLGRESEGDDLGTTPDWTKDIGVGGTNIPVREPESFTPSNIELAQNVRDSEGFAPGPIANYSSQKENSVVKESMNNYGDNSKEQNYKEKLPMNFDELKKRAERRLQAYHQGNPDLTPDKDPKDLRMGPSDDEMRQRDRHMDLSNELDIKSDDLPSGDKELKGKIQRASLEERRQLRASYLAAIRKAANNVEEMKDSTGKTVALKNTQTGNITQLAAKDKDEDEEDKEDDKDDKKEDKKEKKAYHQGTEPHQKYAPMGDADSVRDSQDKQMQQTGDLGGSSGSVPGDEQLKRQMQRVASMKARFTKGASVSDSSWTILDKATERPLLTVKASAAYGDELGDKVEGTAKLNDGKTDLTAAELFVTPVYAKEVMARIREDGLKAVAEELGAALPADEAPALPAPEAPEASDADVSDALAKIESAVEEIRRAVGADDLKEVSVPAEDMAPVAASAKEELKKVYAYMKMLAEDLSTLTKSASVNTKDRSEAVADAKTLVAHYHSVLAKFAAESSSQEKKASEALKDILAARAARREELLAQAMDMLGEEPVEELGPEDEEELDDDALDRAYQEFLSAGGDMEDVQMDDVAGDELEAKDKDEEEDEDEEEEDDKEEDKDEDEQDAEDGVSKEEKDMMEEVAEEEIKDHEEDMHALDSYASKKAWRDALLAKIAAQSTDDFQGMKMNEEYDKTRSDAGTKTELDNAVSDNNDMVENLHEQHRQHLDVARSEPRNVRMAAEALDKAVKSGVIKEADLNSLVAEGKADADAVSYYKQYFGQVDADFANGLVAEFSEHKKEASVSNVAEEHEAKLKRAYAVALDAQDNGLIAKGRSALHAFVDDLIKLPDTAFESMKNIVAQTKASKGKVAVASAPQAGVRHDVDVQTGGYTVSGELSGSDGSPSVDDLARMFM